MIGPSARPLNVSFLISARPLDSDPLTPSAGPLVNGPLMRRMSFFSATPSERLEHITDQYQGAVTKGSILMEVFYLVTTNKHENETNEKLFEKNAAVNGFELVGGGLVKKSDKTVD